MKASDLRKLSDEQILNAIEDQKESLFNLRFQEASGQLEDVNAIKTARHEIARLKTILHERHLAAQHVAGESK